MIPALAADHRVIAIDLPGFGRSARPRNRALIDHYSVFFPELAAEFGIEQATVVGHSLGGAVALTIALEQPSAVDRLVLVAPAGLGDSPPWWWHAIAGTYVNWQAMLMLPNPLAKGVIRGTMRSFLKQRLVHDTRQLEHLIEEFVDKHGGRRELARLIGAGRSLIHGYDGSLLARAKSGLPMPVSRDLGRPGQARRPLARRSRSPRPFRTPRSTCSNAAATTRRWSSRRASTSCCGEFAGRPLAKRSARRRLRAVA